MNNETIFESAFKTQPIPSLLLKPDAPVFTIVAASDAYLLATAMSEQDLVGRGFFDVFPENADGENKKGSTALKKSLQKVVAARTPDKMPVQRYGLFSTAASNDETLYWEPSNTPILNKAGAIDYILHTVKDVTSRELREKEAMMNEAQRLAGMGSWNFDFRTDSLTWTDGLYDVFDVDKGTFLETHGSFVSLVDADDRERVVKTSKHSQETGEPFHIEYRITTPSGEKRIIEEFGYSEKDENGKIVRLFGTAQNITERRNATQALQTSEARYRGFYESQTNYVLRSDMAGNYSYVNKKFIEDFGWLYPDGMIVGKSCLSSIMEYHHEKVAAIVAKCVAKPGEVFKIEIDKPTQKGGTVTTIWDFICIADGNGTPTEIQCSGIDISERIKYEKALLKSNERYEYVNKATDDAIYDWNVEEDVIDWGDGFYRNFGYNRDNKVFRPGDRDGLIHPVDREKHQQRWDGFLADMTQHRWLNSFRLMLADGKFTFVEETAHLLRDKDGNPKRMIGALRDVSEAKQAEAKKNLEHEIAEIFKEGKKLADILKSVLHFLTDFANVKMAEIWLLSLDEEHLNLVSTYLSDEIGAEIFDESVDTKKLAFGKGLPGRVWQNGTIEAWDNIHTSEEFIGHQTARSAGLRSAIGIPLSHNEKFVGVLVLGSDRLVEEQDSDKLFLHTLEDFLGAEIKRKQQEEELNLLFDSAPDIIALASSNGYFSKVNSTFCALLDRTEAELTSQPFLNFVHPKDLTDTRSEYGDTTTGKRQAINFVNRYRTRAGHYKWISWNTSKVFGEDGAVIAFGRDITGMVELQQLFDNAAKLARIGSWEVDLQKKTVYWSTITREIIEVGADYVPTLEAGLNFYQEGLSRDTIKLAVAKAIATNEPWDEELELVTAKGNSRWVRAIGEGEQVGGQVVRLRGSFQDIHQRKVAELALAKAYEEKTSILESIDDGFFTVDRNWTVTYWNNAAETMTQVPKEAIVGRYLWDVFPDHTKAPAFANYNKAMVENTALRFEDYADHLDKWFEISAYPSASGLTGYFKDITDRKKTEIQLNDLNLRLRQHAEELAASNAELEQFAYVASHDLQEPLRMITGFLTQLENKYSEKLDDRGKTYIGFATDGAKRMRQIILDLLEFSRVGRIHGGIEEVDVNQVLSEINDVFSKKLELTGGSLTWGEMPVLKTAKTPLIQVFQNLISNSLKYHKAGVLPTIEVAATLSYTHWQFSVKDNGLGISPEYFQKIFVIFQRLHTKDEYSGTGMGLSICKKIVENLGGRIWVESEEGTGSTFFFTLPAS